MSTEKLNTTDHSGTYHAHDHSGKYYTKGVLWAYQNGVTNGATATLFKPMDPCTRGQIVTFLYRYMT